MRRWKLEKNKEVFLLLIFLFIGAKLVANDWTLFLYQEVGNLFLPHWNMKYERVLPQRTVVENDEPKKIKEEAKEKEIFWEDCVEVTADVTEPQPLVEKEIVYSIPAFYQVDPSTCAIESLFDFNAFLQRDMKIDMSVSGPKVLIYHTHGTEAYKDSRPGVEEDTVIGVGDYLASILTEQYGIPVLHHRKAYDREDKENSYLYVSRELPQILEANPSIQVVIDLHRDGVDEQTRLVTVENGKKMAQIMFFNGVSQTKKNGAISYLNNPNLMDNLAFSFQTQVAANEYYPGIARKIYLKAYRYNMHLRAKSMLIELGAQTNTVEEVMNACDPLAHIISIVLGG